jgi:hypothetical protein
MSTLKTQRTSANVQAFLEQVEDESRRQDCLTIANLMQEATGEGPAMWGSSIVGFGSYTYTYASGQKGEWFKIGFSPRKRDLTLYIMSGFQGYDSLLAKLGKFKTGKACLYIKKLEDIDLPTLEKLIRLSIEHVVSTNA